MSEDGTTPRFDETSTRQARLLAGFALRCREARDTRALLGEVCGMLSREFGVERAIAYRLVAQTEALVAVATCGDVDFDSLSRQSLSLMDWPLLRQTLDAGHAVFVDDAPADALPDPLAREFAAGAFVAVPLAVGGRRLAFVAAGSGGDRFELHPDDLDLLTAVGIVAAAFLDRALEHEQLRRLTERERQFVALASHELPTPFAVMHGIITTLHERGEEIPDEQRTALGVTLHEQSERMRRLIDQLLDLSRLEANGASVEPDAFRIRPRVEGIVELVAGERTDEVAIDVAEDLEVIADPKAFDAVVSNLLTNAFRHGRAPIRIAAHQRDRHFRLVVEDRGRGVAHDFVPRLFERFSRGKEGSQDGIGLGLSIAQSYAHAHGGELLYEDAEPHGARFELVLPRAGPDRE